MSGKSAIFTPLAADARPGDVALRIHAIISAMPEKEEAFRQKFIVIMDSLGMTFSHSESTAVAHLKAIHDIATGKQEMGQFMRRFLNKLAVRAAVAEEGPSYEEYLVRQNGVAVAGIAGHLGHDVTNVPEKASFRKSGRSSFS